MNEWVEILKDDDLIELRKSFDFHDSLIISINYKTGNTITKDNSMVMCKTDCQAIIKLKNQLGNTIELAFGGVETLKFSGTKKGYFYGLDEDWIEFFSVSGERYVCWLCCSEGNFDLTLNGDTEGIIARSLKWRKI